MKQGKTFVVYQRSGNIVTPHRARLRWVNDDIRIFLGAPIPWSELYGGHTQWIADQMDRVRDAIKQERARRAARKAAATAAPV